jgi:N-acetylneuraminate synthase
MFIGGREIGPDQPPFVIAEIGINHEGDIAKARRMIEDAKAAGCECVKFQSHVIDDEYVPAAGKVIPGNAKESILEIMKRCAFDEGQERELKAYTEKLGMLYLSTPFSRAAANRLEGMGVLAYKIGSGECNNTPLVEHIASFGKPILVSTGMNDLDSIARTVAVLERHRIQYGLFHCTSMYPTPYDKVRLGALAQLATRFPRAVLGLSDHSLGIYTCLAAVPLGARLLEKHFTSDPSWPGPDVSISITPAELKQLIEGSRAVFQALGGAKNVLPEEQPTIDFAYASVVTTARVAAGERFTRDNLWVKRPGTGEILAARYEEVIGRTAARDLAADALLAWSDVSA